MDARRWERAERIFHACVERVPPDDDAVLAESCPDDPDLRATVEALLLAHRSDPAFLDAPVARVAMAGATDTAEAKLAVPGYRVVRPLGRGGMGDVFLAVQEGEGFQRPVALKLIQPGLASVEVMRRFRLERRILAGLDHPNIARLLDGGVAGDGRPFFAMEYVEGVPVDRYCDTHRLGVAARIALFETICRAVQHAHENLVLHRDLKPANVLVRDDGVPKLLDFGIAKVLALDPGDDTGVTRTRTRALTPEHAAPEQLTEAAPSAATDVYGLGVLLFELLTGTRPFRRGTGSWRELEEAVLADAPPLPSEAVLAGVDAGDRAARRGTDPRALARRLAGDLDTIVSKALRKEPERRYTSVAALAEDLSRHRRRLPVRARPDTLGYRTSRFVRRHLVPLGAGVAVAVALVGATTVSAIQSRRAQAESRRAQAERDKALEVRSFLLEMFGATGASRDVGGTVTARELLDRQAEALESGAGLNPELLAEMTSVLAEGYDRLGLLAPAARLAERALELRREHLPPAHPDVARSMALLGWIRHEEGDAEAADSLLRTAVARLDLATANEAALARALNDLGVHRESVGDFEEAEALYDRALEIRRDLLGPEHRAVGVTASNLSVIRYRRADYAGAVEAAQEALAVMRRTLGPDHQRTTIVQSNLAAMQVALGDNRGAEAQYQELLRRQEALQGPEHPVTLQLLSSLATVHINLGRWEEAEERLRRLVEARTATLGAGHPLTADAMVDLAKALLGLGRTGEARALSEDALGRLDAGLGRGHPTTAGALLLFARTLAADEPTRAESLHREAVALMVAAHDEGHPETADARVALADFLATRGRWGEAAPLYRTGHLALLDALPANHPHLHRTRVLLARALARTGAGQEADSLLAAARAAFGLGGADPEIVALADSLQRGG